MNVPEELLRTLVLVNETTDVSTRPSNANLADSAVHAARFTDAPRSHWRELAPPPPSRSFRDGDLHADLVVVGLGAAGLLAVSVAAEAGARVIGVDAGSIGRGAAGANGGFLLAGGARFLHDAIDSWGRDRAMKLWDASLREFAAESTELDPSVVGMRRCGSLRVAGHPYNAAADPNDDEVDDLRRYAAALREAGQGPLEREVGGAPAVYLPCDGWVDPARRVNALADRARHAGGMLLEHETVTAVRPGRVDLTNRSISCSFILVTVDGHLEELLPGLPVESWRLQMAYYAAASGARLPVPTYMRWGFEYGVDLDPLVHGEGFALGGFRDRDLIGERATSWSGPAMPSSSVQGGIDELAAMIAGRPVAPVRRWAATVSYTEDLWPLVVERLPGVWAVGGLSGHGNLIGPLAARAIAGRLTGSTVGADILSWLAR